MAGSTFGTLFTITTWGESHGPALGVVVDGCPAGIPLTSDYIQTFLDRRKPGQSKFTTARKESDSVEILSGVFEGYTTGTPISLIVRNTDQRSHDYSKIKDCYRPGHADYTFDQKYGVRDYRGGGRTSGRETIGRVAGGAIACRILEALGIHLTTYTKAIGPFSIPSDAYDYSAINENQLYMPNQKYAEQASAYLESCIREQDSSGGLIECMIHGMPSGIGEPVFNKLDAALAKAVMSIGAVKGVEIGDGFSVVSSKGSKNNDSFFAENGQISKLTNHSGGILGGLSDGSPILLRAAIKPTPSISQPQKTVNTNGENIKIEISGRHDPVIVPRAVVVVESMAAVTLVDLLMQNMSSRIEYMKQVYLGIEFINREAASQSLKETIDKASCSGSIP